MNLNFSANMAGFCRDSHILYTYMCTVCTNPVVLYRCVGIGPAGPVLAGPLFLKVKTKVPFYKKQVINRSAGVIFGLVRLIILRYNG